MKEKLFDSEAKVMEILWREGPLPAKEISLIAADSIGWNKNTTYTVIKKLEAKGFIRRDEPGFVCTPLISEKDIRKNETSSLLTRFFGGSRKALFSALIEDEELSDSEVEELKNLIDKRLGAEKDKKKTGNKPADKKH
ncbi:MAG: BlaI/MecI/CopY family transcriptional regulator [Lachnospiraceae bacterium]|nr:BlaI/MecI/CopY family transcriptional regulator [Lachnospiraceae bacterium]